MAEHSLKIGPFVTRFLECGDRAAPPLVLLHDGAWGGCSSVTWSRVIPALASQYWVLAPDLLGFGGTDKAVFVDRDPYNFRIEHLAQLLSTLEVRAPVHLIGNSFGGSVALRACLPSTGVAVRSVVSINGSGGPWRTARAYEELGHWDGTEEDMRRVVDCLIDAGPGFDAQVAARTYWARKPGHYRAMLSVRIPRPAGLPHVERADDWLAQIAKSATPTLLVGGARDVLLEPGWMANIAAVSASCAAVELDCKHAPNIDQIPPLLDVVLPFLAAH